MKSQIFPWRLLSLFLVLLFFFSGMMPALANDTTEAPAPIATETTPPATDAQSEQQANTPSGNDPTLTPPLSVKPEAAEPFEAPPIQEPITVQAILNEETLATLPNFTLPLRQTTNDNNLTPIYELAVQYMSVTASVTDGAQSWEESLSVKWDFSAIDQTSLGHYVACGTILLPDGYVFATGVRQCIEIAVDVCNLPPAVITAVENWHPYTDAFAITQGNTLDTIKETLIFSPYRLECFDDAGLGYMADIQWDFSAIDTTTVGLYTITGTLIPPEGTRFAENLVIPTISLSVSVQAQNKPDINCLLVGRGSILFPWVTPPGDLNKVQVWLSENGGVWQPLSTTADVSPSTLTLFTDALTEGNTYRLQVDYDGGRTGILTFTYADDIVIEGYREGDRDGGDIGGTDPGEIIQPAPQVPIHPPAQPPLEDEDDEDDDNKDDDTDSPSPEKPSDPSPQLPPENTQPTMPPSDNQDNTAIDTLFPSVSLPSATRPKGPVRLPMTKATYAETAPQHTETFTDTLDMLSGTRFLMMLQTQNGKAVFSKDGITVTIPEAALPATIQPDDQIQVLIKKLANDGVTFLFTINDEAINELAGTTITLPCHAISQDDTLYLADTDHNHAPLAYYDDATHTATFEIDHPGTYYLNVQASAPQNSQPASNDLTIAFFSMGLMVVLVIGGVILLNRKERR